MYGVSIETAAVMILCFARVFGFFYFFPLISSDQVPPMVKTLTSMAITPFLGFPQLVNPPDPQALQMFYLLLGKEALVGAFLGLVVGLPMRLPDIVGSMIDNQRGSAVTDTYNPTSGSDASLLGQLMALTVVVVFLSSGGFLQLIAMLAGSFQLIPLDGFEFRTGENAWNILLELFVRYLALFVILTLPVMAAMFLAEISLALASRFAQSLNVFTLAQPIKALVAISMLITLMPRINGEITAFIDDMIRRFSGG
jgi:type III secretion protein SpaR/YscT/HrcT